MWTWQKLLRQRVVVQSRGTNKIHEGMWSAWALVEGGPQDPGRRGWHGPSLAATAEASFQRPARLDVITERDGGLCRTACVSDSARVI